MDDNKDGIISIDEFVNSCQKVGQLVGFLMFIYIPYSFLPITNHDYP